MLTRYGTNNIVWMLIGGAAFLLAGALFGGLIVKTALYTAGSVIVLFTLWFFRDPGRNIPEEAAGNDAFIISPADGKVVEVIEEYEKHYIKDNVVRISIFLSPVDVHVNRSPVTGKVEFYEYQPGDYLVAYHPKSSELNEHSRIGVQNRHARVFFKQIVGVLARRIVCELKVGDTVQAGEKFGMMKFGSRMDVSLPVNSSIFIKKGQRVVGGETVLASLPNTSNPL